jgi:hypothetical protein
VCSKTMEGDKVPSLPAGAVTVIHNDSQKKWIVCLLVFQVSCLWER